MPCLQEHLTSTFLYRCQCNIGWGTQGQQKTKLFGCIFSHVSQLMSVRFGVVLEKFKLNFGGRFFLSRKETVAFTDFVIKGFNTGMHADVYELTSFSYGMMTDSMELYILSKLSDLNLHSKPQSCKREKISVPGV